MNKTISNYDNACTLLLAAYSNVCAKPHNSRMSILAGLCLPTVCGIKMQLMPECSLRDCGNFRQDPVPELTGEPTAAFNGHL